MPSRGSGASAQGPAGVHVPAEPRPSCGWRRSLALAAVVLSVGGCSLAGRGDYNPFRAADARRISVVIENRNTRTVEVELLSPGRRVTLGRVPGGGRSGVSIPWSRTADVSFRIDPLVSGMHTTTTIRVSPGEEIELWVQEPVELSVIRR